MSEQIVETEKSLDFSPEEIMSLEFDDFCYAVNNKHPKFAHEILYVFNKEYELDSKR